MAWYFIVLIVLCAIISLFVIWFLLSKILKPKFKYKVHKKTNKEKSAIDSIPVITNPKIGLNLDGSIAGDKLYEEETVSKVNDDIDKDALDAYKNYLKSKTPKKTILEEIRQLSPELKVLLFDRGLARKDYDFNSKKD
jgi:hypothetical protein